MTAQNAIKLSYLDDSIRPKELFMRVEKRIRKHIRGHEGLKPQNILFIELYDSLQGKLCHHFLSQIAGERITFTDNKKKATCLVHITTLDAQAQDSLQKLCTNTLQLNSTKNQETMGGTLTIAPLEVVLNEELAHCAHHLGITAQIKETHSPYQEFLDTLEEKYPGTKFALGKSITQLHSLEND